MNRIHPLKIAGVVLLAWSSTSVPAFAAEAAPGEADTEAGLLFLSQDEQREAFAEVDEMAPTRTIHAGATPRPLPPAEQPMPPVRYEVDGETFRLEDFLAR